MSADQLCWLPERGLGYFPVSENVYGPEYFQNYERWADTPIGEQLNAARLALVARHFPRGPLVDIGIGSGKFVESRDDTKGFDVNPAGVQWLERRGIFCDPFMRPRLALTFFDSLEHIHDFKPLLDNTTQWVFVSIPIFRDLPHLLGSKHLKKSEHVWYFTEPGLLSLMSALGWTCVESNDEETRIGREDILSYAFRRA